MPPSFWKRLRVLEELDDLEQLFLGLLDAGYVLEGDLLAAGVHQLRLALAERHGAVAAGLHLAHEEDPQSNQNQQRSPTDQHGDQGRLARLFEGDQDIRGLKLFHQTVGDACLGGELGSVGVAVAGFQCPAEYLARDRDLVD